ncbi:MAG: YnfA family protein [Pseudomonadota bacterium]
MPDGHRHGRWMTSVAWSFGVYVLAAIAEIAGCFAFWAWLRLGKSAWWLLPGMLSLILFAVLLTQVDLKLAGRAYAAYGGIYITASIAWLWLAEGQVPTKWDLAGVGLCLTGMAVILFGPHSQS